MVERWGVLMRMDSAWILVLRGLQHREEGSEKGLIDFIATNNRLKRDVLDAKLLRGMFDGCDHLVVTEKV